MMFWLMVFLVLGLVLGWSAAVYATLALVVLLALVALGLTVFTTISDFFYHYGRDRTHHNP